MTQIDEGVRGHLSAVMGSQELIYQTLYRKYRSQTFADLVGQDATARALKGAVASDRVAHAYLFSGTRGTGKTSTARLLAKSVNCLRRPPGSSEPCNQCQWCTEMAHGSALDLIEIDAASNRGIDEIRDLREKVNLAPALGGKKIYIIDEAHMLTPEAFNALLKTLEEPPGHVIFVLCTTEANKIPATVLGRCQHFVFRRLSDEQIAARLAHISQAEGFEVEPEALAVISRAAQGSMRDGIGLMDQMVPMAEGKITLATAREVLGLADPARLEALLELILAGDAGAALRGVGRIYEEGGELRQLLRSLMELTRDRLLAAIERRDQAMRARLALILDGLLALDGEMRRHAEPRFLVEATLVRLAVETGQPEPGPAPALAPALAPPTLPTPAAPSPAAATGPARPPTVGPDQAPAGATPSSAAPELLGAAPPRVAREDQAGGADDVLVAWRSILETLGPKVRAYFVDATPSLVGGDLVLSFRFAFHHKMALENQAPVEEPVRAWLGPHAKLDLRLQETAAAGMAGAPARPLAPEEDPLVVEAVRKFEGHVTRVREIKK